MLEALGRAQLAFELGSDLGHQVIDAFYPVIGMGNMPHSTRTWEHGHCVDGC